MKLTQLEFSANVMRPECERSGTRNVTRSATKRRRVIAAKPCAARAERSVPAATPTCPPTWSFTETSFARRREAAAPAGATVASRERRARRSNKVPHVARPEINGPAHVVLRIRRGLPGLRSPKTYRVLERSFRDGCERQGFRLIVFSVQRDHVHAIVEAEHKLGLARGMQGLMIRIAKRLGAFWRRTLGPAAAGIGRVFADRYFSLVLESRTQIRRAIRYVLQNGRKHGEAIEDGQPDPYSSGKWYRWMEGDDMRRPLRAPPLARSRVLELLFLQPLSIRDLPGPRHMFATAPLELDALSA